MITAKICRPVQRADKRSQVPREPGDPIPLLACTVKPPITGYDRL
jgi:hypothetical protein